MERVGLMRVLTAVVAFMVAFMMVVQHPVWAQERAYEWGWGMHHPMWGFWGIWGVAMMLMMFVFWGVVTAGIVIGMRWLARHSLASKADVALEILRQRYARGEINKEEFEARKRDLS
jgi:putative membrane protein